MSNLDKADFLTVIRKILPYFDMELKLSDFPEISNAPVAQKIDLIDELWEQVRRSAKGFDAPKAHLEALEQRLSVVREDPSLVLSPSEARAQLKK